MGAGLSPSDRTIAKDLKERLLGVAGGIVREVLVYGSRARGDAAAESDLDVLVLVETRDALVEEAMDKETYDCMRELGFQPVISLRVMSVEEFQRAFTAGFGFYQNVRLEGVAV